MYVYFICDTFQYKFSFEFVYNIVLRDNKLSLLTVYFKFGHRASQRLYLTALV